MQDQIRFDGQSAVVTGAASGIGLAVAILGTTLWLYLALDPDRATPSSFAVPDA